MPKLRMDITPPCESCASCFRPPYREFMETREPSLAALPSGGPTRSRVADYAKGSATRACSSARQRKVLRITRPDAARRVTRVLTENAQPCGLSKICAGELSLGRATHGKSPPRCWESVSPRDPPAGRAAGCGVITHGAVPVPARPAQESRVASSSSFRSTLPRPVDSGGDASRLDRSTPLTWAGDWAGSCAHRPCGGRRQRFASLGPWTTKASCGACVATHCARPRPGTSYHNATSEGARAGPCTPTPSSVVPGAGPMQCCAVRPAGAGFFAPPLSPPPLSWRPLASYIVAPTGHRPPRMAASGFAPARAAEEPRVDSPA